MLQKISKRCILNDPAPQLIFLKASLRNHVTSRDSVSIHFTTSVGAPANDLYSFSLLKPPVRENGLGIRLVREAAWNENLLWCAHFRQTEPAAQFPAAFYTGPLRTTTILAVEKDDFVYWYSKK